jgi:hypothetical protein
MFEKSDNPMDYELNLLIQSVTSLLSLCAANSLKQSSAPIWLIKKPLKSHLIIPEAAAGAEHF